MSESDEIGTAVVSPHVCDKDHRWDDERKVWLCLPNPPWFGRVYSSATVIGRKDAPDA